MGQIRKRFNCIVEGDFGELINLWKHDCEKIKKREPKLLPGAQLDVQKKARQAVSLISKGLISKACNRMISHGVASANDPTTIEALRAKYPPRSRELPLKVSKGQAVESMQTLKDSFLIVQYQQFEDLDKSKTAYLVMYRQTAKLQCLQT